MIVLKRVKVDKGNNSKGLEAFQNYTIIAKKKKKEPNKPEDTAGMSLTDVKPSKKIK